jgi:hypothetical protein
MLNVNPRATAMKPINKRKRQVAEKREGYIAAVFVVATMIAMVGFVSSDLRILLFVAVPVAIACIVLSHNKIVLPLTLTAFLGLRCAFGLFVTGDLRFLAGVVVCAAIVLGVARWQAARDIDETRSDIKPD